LSQHSSHRSSLSSHALLSCPNAHGNQRLDPDGIDSSLEHHSFYHPVVVAVVVAVAVTVVVVVVVVVAVAMSVAVVVALARARAVVVALAVVVVIVVAFAVVVVVVSPLPTNSPRQRAIKGRWQINRGQVLCAKSFFSGGGGGRV
jgi:hypothetical protein